MKPKNENQSPENSKSKVNEDLSVKLQPQDTNLLQAITNVEKGCGKEVAWYPTYDITFYCGKEEISENGSKRTMFCPSCKSKLSGIIQGALIVINKEINWLENLEYSCSIFSGKDRKQLTINLNSKLSELTKQKALLEEKLK